ncbi:MAG: InlB B-repeat-containing protein [Draconibacterium sp.]|nr:InlB B-repeat-containing protein [Draconibacterium sp.]
MTVSPVGGGTTTPAVGGPYIYAENTVVNINATANPGFTFTNWSGDVAASGSSSTSVTMDDNQFVTANFTQNEYSLTLNTVGFGSISKTPNQATYHYGDLVQLTATPTAGYVFTGWTGDLVSTDNPANITVSRNHTVADV